MQLHSRDKRKWFAVNFGNTYFKSAPAINPSLAFGLLAPCLLLFAMGLILSSPAEAGGVVACSLPLIFAVGPTDEKIQALRDELVEMNTRAQTIQATADAENRPLTKEEVSEIDQIFARSDQINEEIERRQLIADQTRKLSTSAGRIVEPQNPETSQNSADPTAQPPAAVIKPRAQSKPSISIVGIDKGKHGFRNLGEFAMAVRAAAHPQAAYIDPRLIANAPTTYSSEGTGADGGYGVPPDFRTEIWEKINGEDSLFGRTDSNPTSKNTLVLPADETTPWDSTGGIQAYFESEAGQLSQSKISVKEKTIRLNKLTALVPVTEELLEDAPGLDAYLRKKVGEKFDFKLNHKIVQGTGAGEPMGILKSSSIVSVTKESGQAADTILVENIDKIWSRMYAPLRRDAVWLINQDIEPQLNGMFRYIKDASGNIVNAVPAYMPPGGVSNLPFGTLYGREIVPTQACETVGDKGDIIFVNLKQYLTIYKQGGVRADVSMHLWFDYGVMAYRFILRIAGQPWWAGVVNPRDGSNTLSWAVTLDERT
jgi:HK97 family phage major capsid protein